MNEGQSLSRSGLSRSTARLSSSQAPERKAATWPGGLLSFQGPVVAMDAAFAKLATSAATACGTEKMQHDYDSGSFCSQRNIISLLKRIGSDPELSVLRCALRGGCVGPSHVCPIVSWCLRLAMNFANGHKQHAADAFTAKCLHTLPVRNTEAG